jgi:small conductance mechanosensitive channel
MLTFDQFGISIAPLLATAGVAGIAIGFGAQSLVKDFFTGLFLLIENQIAEGELVELAGKSGVVEEITLRHVRLRDQDGSVHFVPNGIITIVTNKSRS